MYLFNVSEDCVDLIELMFTIWGFKIGLTSFWTAADNIRRKVAAASVTIIFSISLVLALITVILSDDMSGAPWDTKFDGCATDPCGPNGKCMDLAGQDGSEARLFECECDNGWDGPTCGNALACASSPCQAGGGVCVDQPDLSFVCECNSGYAGELCDQVGAVGEPCETLELPHGQATGQCVGQDTRGGSCLLSCDDNYLPFVDGALQPTSILRTCQENGTWTGQMPTCERPDCGATADVAYTIDGLGEVTRSISCSDNTMYGGDSCAVTC